LIPSWPKLFQPTQDNSPVAFTMHANSFCKATLTTPVADGEAGYEPTAEYCPFPSWPYVLSPKQYMFADVETTHMQEYAIATNATAPAATKSEDGGDSLLIAVSSNNWRYKLKPQHRRPPEFMTAHVLSPPANTFITPPSVSEPGTSLFEVSPCPN
jgi:hypothetical protein